MSAKVCSHAEAIAELKVLAQRAASLIHLLEAPTSQPQPQPVTREELDRVDSLAADRDAAIVARIDGHSNRIDGVVRRQSCTEQQLAGVDGRAIALAGYVAELSSRADKLESRVNQRVATYAEFCQLAAAVGDIENTLGRERVVERVAALEALAAAADLAGLPTTLTQAIEGLRRSVSGQRIAGSDLASRVSVLEKLTEIDAWRQLALATQRSMT